MIKSWLHKEKDEGTFVEYRIKTRSAQRKTIVAFLIGIAVFGWAYFFLWSDYYVIHQVQIKGITRLDRGEVESLTNSLVAKHSTWPFRKGNTIFLNTNVIEQGLKNELFIENVIVDKIYPDILRLKIKERQASLVIAVDQSYFEIDRFGVITRELNKDEQASTTERMVNPTLTRSLDAPILKITSTPLKPVQGQEYVSEFRTNTWLNAFKALTDEGFGYRNAELEYPTSTKLILNMFEPYDVYFDLLEPFDTQIDSLYVFMKVKDPSKPITQYIDARIPGKVFFK